MHNNSCHLDDFLIFVYVGKEALPLFYNPEALKEASLNNLFMRQNYGSPDRPLPYVWQPVSEVPKYSVVPLFLGTLKVTLVALLFAAPFSIAAAVYTAEFASPRVREFIKPIIELLAGIPSVVLGFLALIVSPPGSRACLISTTGSTRLRRELPWGWPLFPIIYTVSEDALTAVPQDLSRSLVGSGSDAIQNRLGCRASSRDPRGFFTALVLGFGRAMGETMIVLMASGNAATSNWSFTSSVRTGSAIARNSGEVDFSKVSLPRLVLFGCPAVCLYLPLEYVGESIRSPD
ncbi:MAG: phosphate ABC transporter permease subunit PstC [Terriglobia bacterium]